ncbi:MAG: DNA-binding protein [Candidatus Melainabacteria bacterium]|nr:DNA-binding protein [Candidatus Melainabacteria bacterium]
MSSHIIDTSVVINLHACANGERILSAIPCDFLVASVVEAELDNEISRTNGEYSFLEMLVARRIVTVADLMDDEIELFGDLIAHLDDGEAATIAIAFHRQMTPVIDERKGRARATALGTLEPAWSLELLRHPSVIQSLGHRQSIETLYLALREGRMRIPHERTEEVISLLGEERAKECTCLPGYRARFGSVK